MHARLRRRDHPNRRAAGGGAGIELKRYAIMETFTTLKGFVLNPRFSSQREETLRKLDLLTIDEPLRPLISRLMELPYCFTLQSCYGHFVRDGADDERNIERLPDGSFSGPIEYRIAYVALCLERSEEGMLLHTDLREIPAIDPSNIQYGCAEWFWRRQVNSFALQVEPERYRDRDSCSIEIDEARHIERARDAVFARLEKLIGERPRVE